jgi:putative phosphoesterase
VPRVALGSDTHGVLDPRILEVASGCDHVVHAGDIGRAEILDQLSAQGARLVAVSGNNDVATKWPPQQRDLLARLVQEARLELPGGHLVVVHGDRINPARQRHQRLRRLYPEARLVVYGHSHRQVCDRSASPWIVNPGAAGRSRTFGGPSMVILTPTDREWTLESLRFPRLPR